jgi:hypothetical protein
VQFAITDCVALVREVADHQVRISFDYVHGTKKIVDKCSPLGKPLEIADYVFYPQKKPSARLGTAVR